MGRKRVLDTTTVSALMKADGRAVDHLEAHSRLDVLVPQPVLAEIEYGLARLPKSRRRARLRARFERIADEIGRAPWTDEVSRRFGASKAKLERQGTPLEDFDVAIAAHALAHDAVLATSDTQHMSRVPDLEVEVEDWLEDWEA